MADLVLKASGYRHHMNSLRRIELSTSKGQVFIAGPDGIVDVVVVAATGGTILSGFYGLVNRKNCLEALGAWITGVPDGKQNFPFSVSFYNNPVMILSLPFVSFLLKFLTFKLSL